MRRTVATAGAIVVTPRGRPREPARAAYDDADTAPADGSRCVERPPVPAIPNIIDAKRSPDGTSLVIGRLARGASAIVDPLQR